MLQIFTFEYVEWLHPAGRLLLTICTFRIDEIVVSYHILNSSSLSFQIHSLKIWPTWGFGVLGFWGTICDEHFGKVEAKVICQMLGYSSAYANVFDTYETTDYDEGPIWISLHPKDDSPCNGDENSILDCEIGDLKNVGLCEPVEDFAVTCG